MFIKMPYREECKWNSILRAFLLSCGWTVAGGFHALHSNIDLLRKHELFPQPSGINNYMSQEAV